jgi:hypothetical protein
MKRGLSLLPILLLGASTVSHAFRLDFASSELMEFGQGPHSIIVPGYGEITFESSLDGVLVVSSAYASTEQIEVPRPSCEPAPETSINENLAETNPGFVKIAVRKTPDPSSPLQAANLQPLEGPPDGWNAVPEAASATLGLVGMLMLLLRRRVKTILTARERF